MTQEPFRRVHKEFPDTYALPLVSPAAVQIDLHSSRRVSRLQLQSSVVTEPQVAGSTLIQLLFVVPGQRNRGGGSLQVTFSVTVHPAFTVYSDLPLGITALAYLTALIFRQPHTTDRKEHALCPDINCNCCQGLKSCKKHTDTKAGQVTTHRFLEIVVNH
jgi:hypothetical protein